MNKIIVLLSGLALAALVAGCSPQAAEYCDKHCSCSPCNDMEYEDCVIDITERLDTAAAYDCEEEADDLFECVIERGYCEADGRWHWENTCNPYWTIVDNCIDARSTLR
jgi:hypothetical protein